MSADQVTICVPKLMLSQIKDVLNRVAKAAPDLDKEIVSAVNLARQELFAYFPTDPRIAGRSTDGLSYDEVFSAGYRLGAKAVVSNSECADLGASSTQAFDVAVAWLRRRRRTAFAKLVDGADPELHELAQAFATGLELGVNRFLDFVRDDHRDQELPVI